MLSNQTRQMTRQLELAAGMQEVLKGSSPEKIVQAVNDMSSSLKEAQEEAQNLKEVGGSAFAKLAGTLLDGNSILKTFRMGVGELASSFPMLGTASISFIDGLISGFQYSINLGKSLTLLLASMGGALIHIGQAIIGIPFKIFSGLVETSNKLVGYMEAIARATEDVRKQFGELSSGPGHDVMKMARNIGRELLNTGLSGYRIFGSLDEAIQFVNKTATEMGSVFEVVRNQLEGPTGTAVLLMQKGLGLTGELMGDIARRSRAFGTTLEKELKDIAKEAIQFGKRFKLSSKNLSRDVGFMIKDVKNFGNLAPSELIKVAVQAKKLGLEIKDLQGVIGTFDTFESAAINSAKLGQAFGVTIDAMKMMKAENPADRIQQLKDAFLSAGKSAETMTRQELKLLAQTTGLEEAAVRTALSQRNMGFSLMDLNKQGKLGEKQQLSQQQVLIKLSDSIERIVKAFGTFKDGFGQAFIDGFGRGIFAQKDFMKALMQLNRSLATVKRAGMEVGRLFVEMFPGVSDLVSVFTDFFKITYDIDSIGRKVATGPFIGFLKDVKIGFKDFFNTVLSDPDAIPNLFDDLSYSFVSFMGTFNTTKTKTAFENLSSAMGNVVVGLIRTFSDGMDQITSIISALMTGKTLPKFKGSSIVNKFLEPIKEELISGSSVGIIKDSFEKLFDLAWPYIKPVLEKAAGAAVLIIFGSGFISSAGALLAQALLISAKTAVTSGTFISGLGTVGSAVAAIIFSPAAIIAATVAALAAISVGISNGFEKFGPEMSKKFSRSLAGGAASATAGIVDTITFGLLGNDIPAAVGIWVGNVVDAMFSGFESIFGSRAIGKIENFINSSLNLFKSFGDLVKSIISGDSEKIISSAKVMGSAIIKTIISVFNDLPTAILEIGTKTVAGLIVSLGELAGWTIFTFTPKMIDILGNIAGAISAMIAGAFTEIGNLVGKIPVIGGALKIAAKGISFMFEGLAKGLTSIGAKIIAVADYIKKGFEKGMSFLPNIFGDAAEKGLKSVKKIFGISSPSKEAFLIGSQIVAGMKNSLNDMPDMFKTFADDGLAKMSSAFTGSPITKTLKSVSPMFSVVKGMIEETNELNKMIEQLGPIDIDAKLEKLADRLGIDEQEVKIKHRDINLHINLNVIMEADKVADAVIDTRKVVARDIL